MGCGKPIVDEGWGTALKPAHEPIVVARKPFKGTVAGNVLRNGTGALNIDGCRVGDFCNTTPSGVGRRNVALHAAGYRPNTYEREGVTIPEPHAGRWPPNVLLTHSADCRLVGERKVKASAQATGPSLVGGSGAHDFGSRGKNRGEAPSYAADDGTETVPAYDCATDCPVAMLDRQSEAMGMHSAGAARTEPGGGTYDGSTGIGFAKGGSGMGVGLKGFRVGDSGGASRFFPTFEWDPFLYCAKAAANDRELGMAHHGEERRGNTHATVKPTALMRWLCRLVTPKGGLVLDPFAGSGTTIVAALREGMRAHGCELDAKHIEIARKRIVGDSPLFNTGTGS